MCIIMAIRLLFLNMTRVYIPVLLTFSHMVCFGFCWAQGSLLNLDFGSSYMAWLGYWNFSRCVIEMCLCGWAFLLVTLLLPQEELP
jgi:hypothetical protein